MRRAGQPSLRAAPRLSGESGDSTTAHPACVPLRTWCRMERVLPVRGRGRAYFSLRPFRRQKSATPLLLPPCQMGRLVYCGPAIPCSLSHMSTPTPACIGCPLRAADAPLLWSLSKVGVTFGSPPCRQFVVYWNISQGKLNRPNADRRNRAMKTAHSSLVELLPVGAKPTGHFIISLP
ncbi:hypothetical protein NDU88_005430 [Pleurodeles waltl]|uniref:Uncharacterized protein n=1 Tax=Pleurodeles waltl TaxID=8319 RepID=A0AAV7UIY7_PLEWA|nr:hypothetical protein NDU88_005430 [Pleurodeles waltl]